MTSQENISEELNIRLKDKELHEYRLIALNKFNNMIWESVKHGLNITTELKFIEYVSNIFDEGKTKINIILPDQNKKITSISFKEFLNSSNYTNEYKKEITEYITNKFQEISNSKLENLHHSMADIKLVIIDKEFISDDIIQIEKIIEGNSYSHLLILIGEKSKINLYLRTINPKNNSQDIVESVNENIITEFTDILISKDCTVKIIEQRKLYSKDIIYGRKNILIEDNCNVNWTIIDKDSKLTFMEQKAVLNGDNSNVIMNSIVCGQNSEYAIYNITEHIGANTKSIIQNRCGLKNSKAVVKGLIKIDKNANNSNGYQKSDMLLIDNNSQAISLPDLEIHNDNVKCSHSSAITRLDEEKIFYLESRGISKTDAEKLLIEGFYETIITDTNIPNEQLKESIRTEVLE